MGENDRKVPRRDPAPAAPREGEHRALPVCAKHPRAPHQVFGGLNRCSECGEPGTLLRSPSPPPAPGLVGAVPDMPGGAEGERWITCAKCGHVRGMHGTAGCAGFACHALGSGLDVKPCPCALYVAPAVAAPPAGGGLIDMRRCEFCQDFAFLHYGDGCHANESAAGCFKKCERFAAPTGFLLNVTAASPVAPPSGPSTNGEALISKGSSAGGPGAMRPPMPAAGGGEGSREALSALIEAVALLAWGRHDAMAKVTAARTALEKP